MRRPTVRITLLLFMSLVLCQSTIDPLWAYYDDVKGIPTCTSCGMSREAYSSSRMLIEYEDGTVTGACSIRCATLDLGLNPGKKPKAVRVADYNSKELIDAKNAAWVIGGTKEGVMTRQAKWAFGDNAAAEAFIAESGGALASYDQALKTAREELGSESGRNHEQHHHAGHHMGPGALMTFTPAFGDMIYHLHPAGTWMVNFRFMRMDMNGLRDGTTNVPMEKVSPVGSSPYGFMMTPTEMTMDMYMLMVMYGVTERLTISAMGSYQYNKMDMLMNMGMGNVAQPPMRTDGLGDTEVAASYGIVKNLVGTLAVSIPTGGIDHKTMMMGMDFRAPYDMQTGSGTIDLKPSLTYNALSGDSAWNWGAQGTYVWRTGKNRNDYSLGNVFKATGWLQRAFGPAVSWLRLAYGDTGRIKGSDPEIDKILDPVMGAPTPDAVPGNYGGQRLDAFLGASIGYGPVSLGVEVGVPLYQNLNGLQLKTDWFITAGVQAMF